MDATEAAVARIRSALRDAPKQLHGALTAGLTRLAIHPRQRLLGGHYTELCASYVHTMGDWSYETARQAWKLLQSCVGWTELAKEEAEGRGIRIRPLLFGQRHGQHLLLPRGFSEAIQRLCTELGIVERTADELLDWEDVKPLQRGSRLMCCCPFHDDTNPSMALDPQRGFATCFACGSGHRFDPERNRVSVSMEQRGALPSGCQVVGGRAVTTNEEGGGLGATSTIDTPSALGPAPTSGLCVCAVAYNGCPRPVPSRRPLFGELEHADRQARRTPAERLTMAALRVDASDRHPDRLVYLDEMRAYGWQRVRGKWKPEGHRAVAEVAVGVDIDAIEFPNYLDDGSQLHAAGERLAAWAVQQPHLSGRVYLTQTSLHGVQVVFELTEPQRPGWRKSAQGTPVCDAADAAVLRELEAAGYYGGHADLCVRASGRLIRRPGPRIKNGQPWNARLRYPRVPTKEPT